MTAKPLSSTVAEMRRLLEASTPGGWIAATGPSSIVGWPVVSRQGRSICRMTWVERAVPAGEAEETKAETRANAAFIAAAHNDMPALLDALERMQKALRMIVAEDSWRSIPIDTRNCSAAVLACKDIADIAIAALEEAT